jgi:hypothetical protein
MNFQDFQDGYLFPELEISEQREKVVQPEHDYETSTLLDQVVSNEIDHQPITIIADRLNEDQLAFIDADEWWKIEWQDMPEFIQQDAMPHKSLIVHFRVQDDVDSFMKLIEQRITTLTKSIWFPEKKRRESRYYAYVDEE